MRRGVVTPPYGCVTGGAQRRAAVPRAWPPPTKFRPEIWGVGQVVVPYGGGHRNVSKRSMSAWRSVRNWWTCQPSAAAWWTVRERGSRSFSPSGRSYPASTEGRR